MTAEIAVINKRAVALAADSAVTIDYPGGRKIYYSANKLFMLSQYQPVGIMFFGAAQFMDVPWETIVKLYRVHLGSRRFESLEQYAEDFLEFLQLKEHGLFPDEQQAQYFRHIIWSIRREIEEQLKQLFSRQPQVVDSEIRGKIHSVIEKNYQDWDQAPPLAHIPEGYNSHLRERYESAIVDQIEEVFEKLPISPELVSRLIDICIMLATKDKFPTSYCGVVFAGFGDKDIFPAVASCVLEAVIGDRLKFKRIEEQSLHITFDNDAAVIPFAQSEVVATFIEGIDPFYRQALVDYLQQVFEQFPETLLDEMPQIDDREKTELRERLKQVSLQNVETFLERLKQYGTERHVQPIMYNVRNLPLEELALMAESLVNITSFKRKVSPEMETVGEPIDVAVISKKDGFIWIKRKHYFRADYNQHFFANYYREADKQERAEDE
ncbi:MAG: hypothetical protein KBH93_01705 [Anaerolineae bacterium]|nr:hypothetical protein [Anaerolineae bacterium]